MSTFLIAARAYTYMVIPKHYLSQMSLRKIPPQSRRRESPADAGFGVAATDSSGYDLCRLGVTGALRAWSSGAGPMQFIKKLKRKEKATEPGLGVGP